MTDSAERRPARIRLVGGVIEAVALDALALAVADVDADHLQITVHAHLEVHGLADEHRAGFGDRLRAVGLGVDLASDPLEAAVPASSDEPTVGWFGQPDGTVMLGAVTESGRLSVEQARYAAAVGVPVQFTRRREIRLCGLSEGVAETVVRVLAPLGFSFDAASDWARPAG